MYRTSPRLLLLTICLSLFSADVHSETNLPFSTKSQWPGYGRGAVQSLAISGNYLYAAVSDGGMTVLDITDPTRPKVVAGFEIPSHGSAYDLKISDGYAFVSAIRGIEIVDVHDPAKPRHVTFFASSAELGPIDVVANRVYTVAQGVGGVNVIDVANLAAPRLIGGPGVSGTAQDLQVVGNYAFIAEKNEGLKIVDISEPFDTAQPVGIYTASYDVTGVHVVGETAYVVSFDLNFPTSGTLDVVDVSDRANPQRVGRTNLARGAFGVRVKDKRAYVVGSGDFEIFDVSDAANPRRVGGVALPGDVSGVAVEVSGDYAFIAAPIGGLLVYNISGAGNPVLVATAPLISATAAVDVAGKYAYLLDGLAGVRVLDIADASNPKLVTTITNEGTTNLRVAGNYAYLANARLGLETVNVTDPAHPTVTSVLKNHGDVWDVRVSGANLFAAGAALGLQVFSLADPANPVWRTNVATAGAASGLTLDGTRAYLATQKGLVIFDVSNPAAPALLGVYNPPIVYTAVDVVGSRAYGVVNSGVDIADVTDPANPKFIGFVQLNGPTRVKVVGNFAYISTLVGGGFGGGFVVDVSDPAFPRTRGRFHDNRTVNDIQVVGDRIYAAESAWGLAIIKQEMPPLAFLDNGSFLPDGSFQVRWPGWGDTQLFPQLETSIDLQTWTALTPYVSFDSISTYVFPPTNSGQRIFRLVLPPSP